MPRFRYKAISVTGTPLTGEQDAESRQALVEQLQKAGHLPLLAEPISRATFSIRDLLGRSVLLRPPVRRGDIVLLTRELATLLKAGLPLDTALRTLKESAETDSMIQVIEDLGTNIQRGRALSEAVAEHPQAFDRVYVNMVRAGEAGGALHLVIERLAEYLERSQALRATIITALIYPAILVVVSLVSLLVLFTFVIPQFVPLFADAGAALPLMTRVVFSLAGLLHDFWWLMLLAGGLGLWSFLKWLADPSARARFDGWCLTMPLLGDLLRKVETARLSRTLGTLLENGVPLLTAVRLAADVIGNRHIAKAVADASIGLEKGHGLSQPLRAAGHLPPLAVQLIAVGEESGQLSEMLNRLADIFDREAQTSLRRLITILEPLLILGLGVVIALIIISVLVAILSLNELAI